MHEPLVRIVRDIGMLVQVAGCVMGRVQELAQEGVVRLDARLERIVGQAVEFKAVGWSWRRGIPAKLGLRGGCG